MDDYKYKILLPFARKLVSNYADYNKHGEYTLNLTDLPEHEQSAFAMYYFQMHDRDIDFIYDNKHLLDKFVLMLKTDNDDDKQEFANSMQSTLIKHYASFLQDILDDIVSEQVYEENISAQLTPIQHKDNGEIYWSATT